MFGRQQHILRLLHNEYSQHSVDIYIHLDTSSFHPDILSLFGQKTVSTVGLLFHSPSNLFG